MNIYVVNYPASQAYPTILYQASYINYFTALTPTAITATAPTIAFSNLKPQQSTTMTLSGKSYGVTVDQTNKLYVKLLDNALGFDYTTMLSSAITCTGYTVQWHKTGYIFFLVPGSSKGTTPTIVCSGFTVGSTIQTINIETGIHYDTNTATYSSSASATIQPFTSIPGESNSVSRLESWAMTNIGSINRYVLNYNSNGFRLPSGSYIVIQVPTGLQTIAGQTEEMLISGLSDNTASSPPTVVQATVLTTNTIKVAGYADYVGSTNGAMSFTIFLKNTATGSLSFKLLFYDASGMQIAASQSFTAITVLSTAYFTAGTFGPFVTDALPSFAGETYKLGFKLTSVSTTVLSSTSSNSIVITVPSAFTISSTNLLCRYSTTSGTTWIRSPTCSVSSNVVTMPITQYFNIAVNSVFLVQITSDGIDSTLQGVTRPTDSSVLYTFNVKTMAGASIVESGFYPFTLYPVPPTPVPGTTTPYWYTLSLNDASVIEVKLTTTIALNAGDFIQLDLFTFDDIIQVFPNDVGQDATEKTVIADCGQYPTSTIISDNINLGCSISIGAGTGSTPVRIKVYNEKSVAIGAVVRFYIANIQNPATAIPGGFIFNIMRPCRPDNYGCPIYRRRDYANIGTASYKVAGTMERPTLQAGNADLLQTMEMTTMTFSLTNAVAPTDGIVLQKPLLNINIVNSCTTSQGICVHFPRIGWTFFQPTSSMSGTASLTLRLDNAFFFDRTNKTDFVIWPMVSQTVPQEIRGQHPGYILKVPTFVTDATQTDYTNQYIVRNFDNILKLSITGIWRKPYIQKIVVNIPSSYAWIKDYCMAGVSLDDMSSTSFQQFPCLQTGNRQITIVIDKTWAAASASATVVLYYRGFLPLGYQTGTSANAIITSYASRTSDWVLDENIAYNFYVSPTPTPIIRDLNLNLKSVNDRLARINSYVLFYMAVWPNTAHSVDPITQIIFQVADEYVYPSLARPLCIAKVIYSEQVGCTLKRVQGRTLIYANPPSNYYNGPFLLTITNQYETNLFIAPPREGEFLFNTTYLDALGKVVETSDSYMELSGEFVPFSAQPIVADPNVQTLYSIKFTTSARVMPQGYYKASQDAYTEIVIFFQTYSPAYPLDLGTGVEDGGPISCTVGAGLTGTALTLSYPLLMILVIKSANIACRLVYGTVNDHSRVIGKSNNKTFFINSLYS